MLETRRRRRAGRRIVVALFGRDVIACCNEQSGGRDVRMASAGDALRDCSGDQRRRPRWLRLWESGRTSQNKEQPLPGWKRSPLWSGAEIESCRRKEYCRRKQLVGIDVDNVDGFKERQRAAAGTQSQPERARDEGGSQRKSKPARQVLLHNGRGLLCSCLRLGNDSAQEPIHQRGLLKGTGHCLFLSYFHLAPTPFLHLFCRPAACGSTHCRLPETQWPALQDFRFHMDSHRMLPS
jgi:hypothetical protein